MNVKKDTKPWEAFYEKETNPNPEECKDSNIPENIHRVCLKYANQKAFSIVLENGLQASLNYSDVNAYSSAFAVFLRDTLKLEQGERVAVQLPNCLASPIALFGVLKAACVIVNTNPLYTAHEMIHQFNDSDAKVLVTMDIFSEKLTEVLEKTKLKHIILVSISDFFPWYLKLPIDVTLKYIKKSVKNYEQPHWTFRRAIQSGLKFIKKKKIDCQTYYKSIDKTCVALLQYTGGTTGISKGAMLAHKNILNNMTQVLEMGHSIFTTKNTVLNVLPLYHIFAFTMNLMAFFSQGSHNILIPNPRPLRNLKPAFKAFKITCLPGVNTLFNALLHEKWFHKNLTSNLKIAIAGGSTLHAGVAKAWEEFTESPIIEGYGLTECSPVVSLNPLCGLVKRSTVGIPIPCTDVKILNSQGEELASGETGEIAVKGPQVFLGYWKNKTETEKTLLNGWFLTGDIGVIDSDGYLKIIDRKKDLIIVSGFNVYPNEIEDTISKMPQVLEVAVIGVPDKRTGEAVCAIVVKKEDSIDGLDIKAYCRKYLTSYKIPRKVIFTDQLPKSPIGKILRKELKKKYQKDKVL